ncbi:MAG: ATP-dependent helicase [Flavobacterium sp.]|nr:MAG: ATP-dependent helicase [Flavobacterium sp.]
MTLSQNHCTNVKRELKRFKMKPTKQQEAIIDYDGNAVIIAAPGSGKTFVISQKIKSNLKLLAEHEGVIAISYTNKASVELKNRSLSNGENPKCSFFGTIDKFNLSEIIIPFAKHLFGIPENEIKIFKIADLDDEAKILLQWFQRDLILDKVTDTEVNILKSFFLKGFILIDTIGIFANYVFTHSQACQNYLRSRYKYIYIDEYQDSGFEQHQTFLKIKSLQIKAIAVGDLNQSIYAFSGKDAKYLDALTRDDTFRYFKLDKNHRCHSSIINYSNYLLNPKTELIPTDENYIFFKRIDGDEKNIALWIEQSIENLQNAFGITYRNEIAILTRTTRTGEIIHKELHIPNVLSISNELDHNLNVWSAIFSNLLLFCFNNAIKFIDAVETFKSYDDLNPNELKTLAKSKKAIEKLVCQSPLPQQGLIQEFVSVANIIAPNSESVESVDLLHKVLHNDIELRSYKLANENEVNIMTLHKSKGLEFELVIHLDLHEWILPNKKPGPNNDFNNPIYGDWKQDINLHYVGITRAKKCCFLISSTRRTNAEGVSKNGKDSEFIWHNQIQNLRFKRKANS